MICTNDDKSLFCRIARKVDETVDIPNKDLVRLVQCAIDSDNLGMISDDVKEQYELLKHEIDFLEEVAALEMAKDLLKEAGDSADITAETKAKLNGYLLRFESFQLKFKRLHGADNLDNLITQLRLMTEHE